jgi:lon-related putative ATP-dependent protease
MKTRKPNELSPRELRHACDEKRFNFKTTKELDRFEGVIEQERAIEALNLGLSLYKRNYNVYVSGSSGTGKMTIVMSMLAKLAAKKPSPSDWVYVHSFRNKEVPMAIQLDPGRGAKFQNDMANLIKGLEEEIPKTFQSRGHQEKVQEVINLNIEQEQNLFMDLSKKGSELGFVVKSTKTGIITIPTLDNRTLSNKDYEQLSGEERKDIEERRKKLDPVIASFLQKARKLEAKTQKAVQKIQMELGRGIIAKPINALRRRYAKNPAIKDYLGDVAEHILAHIGIFMPQEQQHPGPMPSASDVPEFKVNVVVDNSATQGAPVVNEARPTFYNLFGRIEKKVENGIYFTDFTMIKAGSVLKANGGYLILHASDLFMYPLVWENLKSILRYKAILIEDIGENMGFLPTSGLRPEPIPIDLKVVLIGSHYLHEMLQRYDEDYRKLFQVVAEFDSEIDRSPTTEMEYARFVATTCEREGLRPVDRTGVAAVVEYGSRLVDSQKKMTLRFNEICNLLIEADFLANQKKAAVITRKHVQKTIEMRHVRRSLVEDKIQEGYKDNTILVKTEGTAIGAVNGLAVYEVGGHAFGKPSRITATVFAGKGGITNVEREARLSGPFHSKGVLIISGFLGDRFARTHSLSMTVSLVFEQSYGPVDGDSASSTELYAVLSALSRVPLRQDLAVTGSVDQLGNVQPIGGVNEKIEGWFSVCRDKGFTGTQGVMIPKQNVQHLMLDAEVVEAVEKGKFHIYPIATIEEGIELLTGIGAGTLQEDGQYPEGSIFDLCLAHLDEFDRAEHGEEGGEGGASEGGEEEPSAANPEGGVGDPEGPDGPDEQDE